MRLWSLHPKYLDAKGMVALWRETLLAQAVLHEQTKGYKNHPQLNRFKACSSPTDGMSIYLQAIHQESIDRGYRFDGSKIYPALSPVSLTVTQGQMAYEWQHLLEKLRVRSPELYEKWHSETNIQPHPMFSIIEGGVEDWERV